MYQKQLENYIAEALAFERCFFRVRVPRQWASNWSCSEAKEEQKQLESKLVRVLC